MIPYEMGFGINKEVKMNGGAKKNLKTVVCAGIVTLALAGCVRANFVNPNSVVEDGIEYYLQTDKAVYDLGENVEMLYRVTNLTENPVDIGDVLIGPWCDFFVTDDDNTDIWQWMRVPPPSGWEMLHLEPYESKELQITWDMISDNATPWVSDDDYPIGPGSYRITGELKLSGAYSDRKVPVSVSIEVIPEPASMLLLGTGLLILLIHKRKK